jgi:hypothetical protein
VRWIGYRRYEDQELAAPNDPCSCHPKAHVAKKGKDLRYGGVDGEVWPNFFIVGAAKAGTTSLYRYLAQHPDTYMPKLKEPHWFSRVAKNPSQHVYPVTSEAEYLNLFKDWRGERAIGEASPSYLWDRETPYRIRRQLPNSKIIVLLRNPVDRAFSHYLMDVRSGIQDKPFHEALVADRSRCVKRWGVSHLYVELGQYRDQILRYQECFGRERVLVLFFEEIFSDPRASLEAFDRVLCFLGVDSRALNSSQFERKHNPYTVPRGKVARVLLRHNKLRTVGSSLLSERAKRFLSGKLLLREAKKPKIEPQALDLLRETYEVEVEPLKRVLGRELTWDFPREKKNR